MKIYSKKVTGEKNNPSDYAGKSPRMKVGDTHKNLYDQADFAKKISTTKITLLLNEVGEIYDHDRGGSIDIILDSISHYINEEIRQSKEDDEYLTTKMLEDMHYNVSKRIELAKFITKILFLHGQIKDLDNVAELTKHGVLF